MRVTTISLLIAYLAFIAPALCLHNITIDDNAPEIVYQGTWNGGTAESYSYGGTHKYSIDRSATATFSFNGTYPSFVVYAYYTNNIDL